MGAIRLSEDFKDIATNVFLAFTIIGFVLARLISAEGSPLYPTNNPVSGNISKPFYNISNTSGSFEKIFSVSTNEGEKSIKLKNVSQPVASASTPQDNKTSYPLSSIAPKPSKTTYSVVAPVESIASNTVNAVETNSLSKITNQILPNLNTGILNVDLKL